MMLPNNPHHDILNRQLEGCPFYEDAMEREIKFRAWDKDSSRMLPVAELDLIDGFILSNDVPPHSVTVALPLAEIELMQFTGLKDKNGKEIYEGDIVIHHDDSEVIGKIIFYPSYGWSSYWKYRYPSQGQRGDFFLTGTIAKHVFENGQWAWETNVEVIGNVHENPELLEQKEASHAQ
jgi:hypothetical protein